MAKLLSFQDDFVVVLLCSGTHLVDNDIIFIPFTSIFSKNSKVSLLPDMKAEGNKADFVMKNSLLPYRSIGNQS